MTRKCEARVPCARAAVWRRTDRKTEDDEPLPDQYLCDPCAQILGSETSRLKMVRLDGTK